MGLRLVQVNGFLDTPTKSNQSLELNFNLTYISVLVYYTICTALMEHSLQQMGSVIVSPVLPTVEISLISQ
jgi:hypothetical protein